MKLQTKFRVVDNDKQHPRDIARQAVAARRKRLNATRGLCTAHDESREVHAPTMNVDSILDRTAMAQTAHLGKK